MKQCKQCGRHLEDEMFRSYVPRGKGTYKTSVGRNTICKDCESLNAKVARYVTSEETPEKKEFLGKAAALYRELHARGLEPVGVYARQILGLDKSAEAPRRRTDDDLFNSILGNNDPVQLFMRRLKAREFLSTDEAEMELKKLSEALHMAGLYKEADVLLEDWQIDEEAQ